MDTKRIITPHERLHDLQIEFDGRLEEVSYLIATFETPKEAMDYLTKIGEEFIPKMYKIVEEMHKYDDNSGGN